MDDTDAALAYILADCKDADDMTWYIGRLATLVQHMVCCMAREVGQAEAGIRTLYATWADMAVEEFAGPRRYPSRKLH